MNGTPDFYFRYLEEGLELLENGKAYVLLACTGEGHDGLLVCKVIACDDCPNALAIVASVLQKIHGNRVKGYMIFERERFEEGRRIGRAVENAPNN